MIQGSKPGALLNYVIRILSKRCLQVLTKI